MTPAIRYLEKHKIDFKIYEYEHSSAGRGQADNFGQQASQKLALPESQVFKTLMAVDEHNSKNLIVAVVPVDSSLDLKALAKAAKIKRLQMAPLDLAERVSGYVKGGISPFGQKKRLATYLDASAQQFSQIVVSGGKRGLSIGVSPQDFCSLLNACYANIRTEL
ncbi:Cys-tRNA(Pro) deacylase [Alginatibacterium sediminis]|uniref:Cys-tRNA(Pro)/Cys-tRNA(Cys) deacylase n=1 Tax=Alginatibacterium sediminis TaxID=2164068 RepID=A0A420ELH2_9ALTE|nr:Cys-tRNA(Pro) deacylase [Alginatibacterium sediminis]RKF21533.1 Cys-tRNA(Pro) deacylase [Alginatibacterium sediminis]